MILRHTSHTDKAIFKTGLPLACQGPSMSPAEAPGSTTPGRNVFGRFFHWVANATPQFFRQRLDQSSPVSEKRKHEDAFQHASFADEPAHAAGGASQPVATDSQRQEQQREDGQQLKRPRMEQSNLTELFREFKVSNTSQDANAQPCADEHRTPELAWGHLQPRNQDDSAVKPQALNFAFDTPALPASARPEQQQQQKGWHRPAPAQYFRPQLEALQRSRTPYASRHLAVPFGTPMLASAQPSPRGGMAAEASLAGTSQRSIDVLRNRNQAGGMHIARLAQPGACTYCTCDVHHSSP